MCVHEATGEKLISQKGQGLKQASERRSRAQHKLDATALCPEHKECRISSVVHFIPPQHNEANPLQPMLRWESGQTKLIPRKKTCAQAKSSKGS